MMMRSATTTRRCTLDLVHSSLEIEIYRDSQTGFLCSAPRSDGVGAGGAVNSRALEAEVRLCDIRHAGPIFPLPTLRDCTAGRHDTASRRPPAPGALSSVDASSPSIVCLVTEHGPPGVFCHRNSNLASVSIQVTDESQAFFPMLARSSAFTVSWEAVGGGGSVSSSARDLVQKLPMAAVGDIVVVRQPRADIKLPRFVTLRGTECLIVTEAEQKEIMTLTCSGTVPHRRRGHREVLLPHDEDENGNATSRSRYTDVEQRRIAELIRFRSGMLRNSRDTVLANCGSCVSGGKTSANVFGMQLRTDTCEDLAHPAAAAGTKRMLSCSVKSRHQNNDYFLEHHLPCLRPCARLEPLAPKHIRVVAAGPGVNHGNVAPALLGPPGAAAPAGPVQDADRLRHQLQARIESSTDRVTLVKKEYLDPGFPWSFSSSCTSSPNSCAAVFPAGWRSSPTYRGRAGQSAADVVTSLVGAASPSFRFLPLVMSYDGDASFEQHYDVDISSASSNPTERQQVIARRSPPTLSIPEAKERLRRAPHRAVVEASGWYFDDGLGAHEDHQIDEIADEEDDDDLMFVKYDQCKFLGGGEIERTGPTTTASQMYAEFGHVNHFYVAAWELRSSASVAGCAWSCDEEVQNEAMNAEKREAGQNEEEEDAEMEPGDAEMAANDEMQMGEEDDSLESIEEPGQGRRISVGVGGMVDQQEQRAKSQEISRQKQNGERQCGRNLPSHKASNYRLPPPPSFAPTNATLVVYTDELEDLLPTEGEFAVPSIHDLLLAPGAGEDGGGSSSITHSKYRQNTSSPRMLPNAKRKNLLQAVEGPGIICLRESSPPQTIPLGDQCLLRAYKIELTEITAAPSSSILLTSSGSGISM